MTTRKRTTDIEIDDEESIERLEISTHSPLDNRENTAPSSFAGLLLKPEILKGLEKAGYVRPSPIQARAIPIGKIGADLIAQAKSGTGKTVVFSVILLEATTLEYRAPQSLVISPTRELALQTRDVIRLVGAFLPNLGCEATVGGISVSDDVGRLSDPTKPCHIVAGTPGRVRALLDCGALRSEGITHFVLDEADQLLQGEFRPQIDGLFAALPRRKQVLAFSATYTPDLLDYLRRYMRDPQTVLLVRGTAALKGVRQFYAAVPDPDPAAAAAAGPLGRQQARLGSLMTAAVRVLESTGFNQAVVFTNSPAAGRRVAALLGELGFPARYIAGDLPQRERFAAVAALRALEVPRDRRRRRRCKRDDAPAGACRGPSPCAVRGARAVHARR